MSELTDTYRRITQVVVRARQWDGTQAGAGDLVEWVEANGGDARFVEQNETPSRSAPWLAISDPRHLVGYANPGDYVMIYGRSQFGIMSADSFSGLFIPEPADG